ncbi:hypothetical protein FQN54_003181 [Arachnomyces sp. PD_36]|nr:hypothetical protein FQN54_003181 [Arachnomyces sp. PD_36]
METVPELDEQSSRPSTARLDPNYDSSPSLGDDESSGWSHVPENEKPTAADNPEASSPKKRHTNGSGNVMAMPDLTQNLESCNWEELQERFTKAMAQRTQVENALQKETAELLEIFTAWSQTTALRDEERAFKRQPLDFPDTEPEPEFDLSSRFAGLSTSTFASGNKGAQDGGTTGDLGAGLDLPKPLQERREEDRDHVRDLVHVAKEALNRSKELENSAVPTEDESVPLTPAQRIAGNSKGHDKADWKLDEFPSDGDSDNDGNGEDTDDEQADEILQNIIDELGVESGPDDAEPEPTATETRASILTPPSSTVDDVEKKNDPNTQPTTQLSPPAPTLPNPTTTTSSSFIPSIPNLPSAPTYLPPPEDITPEISNAFTTKTSSSSWKNDNTPTHWCCICSDDATRKCFGCEGGLLYCLRCWNEAHIEEGYEEERGHEWVRWVAPRREG